MSPPTDTSKKPPVIVLIGMMGAGKSTVGLELTKHCGLSFEDLDERLMNLDLFNRPASQIIEEDGEDVFRALEHRALQTWLSKVENHGGILATGGGVVTRDFGRHTLMNASCSIVWLNAEPSTLTKRIQGDSQNVRPLLQTPGTPDIEGRISEILNQRFEHYESLADEVIQNDNLNPLECARIIIERLKLS